MMQKVIIFLALTALMVSAAPNEPNSPNNINDERAFIVPPLSGMQPGGVPTVFSAAGVIAILGFVLIILVVVPTIINVFGGAFLGPQPIGSYYRSLNGNYNIHQKQGMLEVLTMLDDVWRKWDVKDGKCQQRLICDAHERETETGDIGRRIAKIFRYAAFLEAFNLPPSVRDVLGDYTGAVKAGKARRGCAQLYPCDFTLTEFVEKYDKKKK